MDEIEKCPKCGEEAHVVGITYNQRPYVQCLTFACWRGPACDTKAEAVQAWNEVAGMRKEIAALKEALAKCSPFHDWDNGDADHPCSICTANYWLADIHAHDCIWWLARKAVKGD